MSVTLDDDEDIVYGLDTHGRPDPGYALGLGMVPASAGRRSAAFCIDAAIVLILTLPLTLGTLPLWFSVIVVQPTPSVQSIITNDAFITGALFYAIGQGVLSLFILVQLIMHGLRGVTIGKVLLKIRSVNVARFSKPGFWRVVLRAIVLWTALAVIPILGALPFLLSPLWDREKRGRGWLDKIGRNWLIDVRRGLDPFDTKALRHARKRLMAPQAVVEAEMPSLATGAAGALPSFVPSGRSRSGVISAQSFGVEPATSWQPPAIEDPTPIPAAPHKSPPQGVFLRFDDGMCVDVSGMGLLGRAPAARENEAVDQLVAVVDKSMRISKTHAAFGFDAQGFWLVDRGSSNGTLVKPSNGTPIPLTPWERSYVHGSSVVEVGGRSFTVVEGSKMNGRDS